MVPQKYKFVLLFIYFSSIFQVVGLIKPSIPIMITNVILCGYIISNWEEIVYGTLIYAEIKNGRL